MWFYSSCGLIVGVNRPNGVNYIDFDIRCVKAWDQLFVIVLCCRCFLLFFRCLLLFACFCLLVIVFFCYLVLLVMMFLLSKVLLYLLFCNCVFFWGVVIYLLLSWYCFCELCIQYFIIVYMLDVFVCDVKDWFLLWDVFTSCYFDIVICYWMLIFFFLSIVKDKQTSYHQRSAKMLGILLLCGDYFMCSVLP